MSKIAIIGLGAGGVTAGIKLAQSGHDVHIFEKQGEENIGHPWMDDIRFDIFEYCKIPPLPEGSYYNKGKRLFISPDCENSFHVPFSPPMVEISVDRRDLSKHMIALAKEAGAKLHFDYEVTSLSFYDRKIIGIVGHQNGCSDERIFFDLVIDCSGLCSPFRAQIPTKFAIESQPKNAGIMFAWRGFYKMKEGSAPPETDRNIHIRHLDGKGLSWCNLNQKGEVDVFIGRIGSLTEEEKDKAVADLYERYDFFSDEVLQEGKFAKIALRSPAPVMVADGYALLGDSAYMTMPMMGSGIEASMKAAVWLTEVINQNKTDNFTANNLWAYQLKYYEELGERYALVDCVKNLLLGIAPDKISWLFGCGAVTDEDMGLVSTDNDGKSISPLDILKKIAILFSRTDIVVEIAKYMLKALKLKKIAGELPGEYNIYEIRAWATKYNRQLESCQKF